MYGRIRNTRWRAVLGACLLCLPGAVGHGQEEPEVGRPSHGPVERSAEPRPEPERASEPPQAPSRPPTGDTGAERSEAHSADGGPADGPAPKSERPGRGDGATRDEASLGDTKEAVPVGDVKAPDTVPPLPVPFPGAGAATPGLPGGAGTATAPADGAQAPTAVADADPSATSPAPDRRRPPEGSPSFLVPQASPTPRETQVLKALGTLTEEATRVGEPRTSRGEQDFLHRVSLWNGELKAEAAKASKLRSDLESERRRLQSQRTSLPWHVRQGRVPLSRAAELRDDLWDQQRRYDELYDRVVASSDGMRQRLATYEAALADAQRLGLSKALVTGLEDSVAQARSIRRDLEVAADTAVGNAKAAGEVMARLLPAMEFARKRAVLWRTEARVGLGTLATAIADLRALAVALPESIWDMATVDTEVLTEGARVWVFGLVGKLLGILALAGGLVWLGRRAARAVVTLAERLARQRGQSDAEAPAFRLHRGLEATRSALAFSFAYGAVHILPLTPQVTLLLTYAIAAWCGYFVAGSLLKLLIAPEEARLRLVRCDDLAATRLLALMRLLILAAVVLLPLIASLVVLDYGSEDVVLGLQLLYGLFTVVLVLLLTNSHGGPLCLLSASDPGLAARLRGNAYLINPAVSLAAVALFVTATAGYVNLAGYVARGALYSLVLSALLWHGHRALRGHIDRRLPPLEGEPETHEQRRGQLLRFVTGWSEGLAVAACALLGALYSWGVRAHHLHRFLDYLSVPLLDIKGAKVSILGLVWGLLVVALSMGVARIVRDNVRNAQTFRERWDPGARYAIASLLHYSIVVGGFVVGILVAGMQLGVLTAFAGLVGVAVGFGSQDIAKNTICGLIIMLDGSINVGDFVDVAGQSGTITDTSIRSTTIRTPDGRNVVVPNSTFYTQNVVVSSRKEGRVRVTVDVNLTADTDLPRARELIRQAALQTPGVLADPAPEVLFKALAAAALNLQIVGWTDRIDEVAVVQQRLMSRVWETIKAEGVALA